MRSDRGHRYCLEKELQRTNSDNTYLPYKDPYGVFPYVITAATASC